MRSRLVAEFTGTTFLLAAIVGSGIMGASLARGNDAVALLANAAATAAMLYVLIALLEPASGAHLNPAVTLALVVRREIGRHQAAAYVIAQLSGAFAGVLLAHAMFDLPLVQAGVHARSGAGQWLSEGVATFGLVATILVGSRRRPAAMPALVACYIFAAYWFTASTSFANPAVTFARAITTSFSGIRPADVGGFVLAQVAGALLATWVAPRRDPTCSVAP
jgi:glycerol uptake facilitator-like aquaporin